MKKQKQVAQATGTEFELSKRPEQNGNLSSKNVTYVAPQDIVNVLSCLTHHVKCLAMCRFFHPKSEVLI